MDLFISFYHRTGESERLEMIARMLLIAWVVTIPPKFVQASVLRLPSENTTSFFAPLNGSSATSLTAWPPLPFEDRIVGGSRLKFTGLTIPPQPPDLARIEGSLRRLSYMVQRGGGLDDPINFDFVDYAFEELVLHLIPEEGAFPMTKLTFLRVIIAVIHLFRDFGPVWFDSQITRHGQIIATFNLSF